MPSEPVSSYLDEAVEAALRAGGNGYHVQAAIEAAEPFIRQQVQAELREALPDPAKLLLLAEWFDAEEAKGRWDGDDTVQRDLRKWANAALTQLGGSEDG